MSTQLPPPPPGYVSVEEFNQLRQQNEQLWKIIERQRTMIQNLQKENSHLSAERDGLQDNVNSFERIRKQRASILVSTETLKAMTDIEDEPSPMPPPRSPYRSNTTDKIKLPPQPSPPPPQQQQRLKETSIHIDTVMDNNNNMNAEFSSINNPVSPKNIIMEKDASNMQKFKSTKPPIIPIPSVSSPTMTSNNNNNNNMNNSNNMEEAYLSSSFSSSTSSFLRPNSPPVTNQRNNQRSKRESHIFFSPPPITNGLDAPAVPSLDSIDHFSHIPVSSASPSPPTPPPHQLTSPTVNPLSADDHINNHNQNNQNSNSISSNINNMNNPLGAGITNISLKVLGSNIRQNEKGREVISFIISVGKKPDENNLEFEELWRVEKLYSHFLDLDAKIKSSRNKAVYNRIAKLPDKALFTTHSPSKVDRRKAALETYLQHVVLLPLEDSSDLCEFLSTNVVDNDVMYSRTGRKEGYLTKRGKNFGGWKSRFFVLNGTNLDYYESKEGNHLGTIRLINAQIGRQTVQAHIINDENNIYRHAFLIIEQKRAGSSQVAKHILCAESDQERDSWVDALFKHVRIEEDPIQQTGTTDPSITSSSSSSLSSSAAAKKKSSSTNSTSSKPTASTSTPSNLPSSNKPYHQDSSDFDKLRTYQTSPSDIGMAMNGSTLTNDSSSSLTSTWSSSTSPPPLPPIILDNQHQHPLQQNNNNNNNNNNMSFNNSLQPHPPLHNLTRRSSMVNLLNKSQEEEITLPARAVSPSPAFGRSSDELLGGDDLPEKKSRHKRMTFWGKKMFSSSSNDSVPFDSQSLNNSASINSNTSTLVGSSTEKGNASSSSSSSSGLRGFLSRPSHEQGRSHKDNHQPQNPVFGVPLDDAVRISRVADTYQLPSIVYRCIEYLDVKKAVLEEGLYRLSGSNTMIKSLKLKFDQEGDVNLLSAKEEYDVHAIAGLLKMWLRELPTSVLTRELRMDFLHVIDLLDRKDRVNELGRLVSLLPIANYTLLRALTAHLIQVVKHSDINKMTMRNVSIVFSPTLGIPGTIFNLLMSEFDYIFWTTEDGDAAPRMILDDENTEYETPIKIIEEPPININNNNNNSNNNTNNNTNSNTNNNNIDNNNNNQQYLDSNQQNNDNQPTNNGGGKPLGRRPTLQLKDGRSNRNSINYREAAPNTIVDLEKHHPGQQALMLDEIEDEVNDLALSDEDYSVTSDDKLQPTAITI